MTAPVSISDHALVRWLERVHGIDMEFYRERLRDELGPVMALGDVSKVTIGSVEFCIVDGVLTTVKPKNKQKHRKRPPRWMSRAEDDFS